MQVKIRGIGLSSTEEQDTPPSLPLGVLNPDTPFPAVESLKEAAVALTAVKS